jgi:flagellar capping protein FliD
MRRNLEDAGMNQETGKLHFDEDKFNDVWARDPEAVRMFFFNERETVDRDGKEITVNSGWAYRFSKMVDNLVGAADITGKLPARIDTLSVNIDRNEDRITFMEERLKFRQQLYMRQFIAMEQAMARMSSDMAAVGNIANAWQSSFNSV